MNFQLDNQAGINFRLYLLLQPPTLVQNIVLLPNFSVEPHGLGRTNEAVGKKKRCEKALQLKKIHAEHIQLWWFQAQQLISRYMFWPVYRLHKVKRGT